MTTRESIDALLEISHPARPAVLEQIKAAFIVVLTEVDDLKGRLEQLERQTGIDAP